VRSRAAAASVPFRDFRAFGEHDDFRVNLAGNPDADSPDGKGQEAFAPVLAAAINSSFSAQGATSSGHSQSWIMTIGAPYSPDLSAPEASIRCGEFRGRGRWSRCSNAAALLEALPLRSCEAIGSAERDLYDQIYPMWMRAGELLRSGHLPLWNPYQGCGHPFAAAVLYGIFYPLNFFRFLLPAQVAMEATLLLHIALAWGFTFWFACSGLRLSTLARSSRPRPLPWGAFSSAIQCGLPPRRVRRSGHRSRSSPSRSSFESVGWFGFRCWRWRSPCRYWAGWVQTWMHMMHALGLYFVVRAMCEARERPRHRVILMAGLLVALDSPRGGVGGGATPAEYGIAKTGMASSGGLSLEQQLTYGVFSPWISTGKRSTHLQVGRDQSTSASLRWCSHHFLCSRRSSVARRWRCGSSLVGVWLSR